MLSRVLLASLLWCQTVFALYANCRTLSGAVPIPLTFECCSNVEGTMSQYTACEVNGPQIAHYQTCCFDNNRGMFISEIDHQKQYLHW
ncbi:MAG: hypothetical protein J3R72DRAFT_444932 [Linnemannia gamsii]|nr:MAG: hypothetical protein J3R72DRAFT_444932 [Linnemannia gamsii]